MVARPETVIFLDLDGCLVDSSVAIPAAMNRALVDLGLPAVEAHEIHGLIGPPLERFAVQLMDRVGAPREFAASFSDAYLAHYAEGMAAESSVYEGIPAALRSLSEGSRLAVVTLKRQVLAERLVEALDLRRFLVDVIGASDAVADKTPLLSRAIAQTTPTQAVMVGDQPEDIVAARRVGIPGIGVAWGFGRVIDLQDAGATAIVESPSDLPNVISTVWEISVPRSP